MRKSTAIIALLGVAGFAGAALNQNIATASSNVYDESFVASVAYDAPVAATVAPVKIAASDAAYKAKQERNEESFARTMQAGI